MVETKNTVTQEAGPLSQMAGYGHEQVLFCNDKATGLRAIIAIHNTVLGPALGGTRMWNYASEAEALTDVLRLSRGMTYKASISNLNLGGGKAVIIGDSRKDKSEALFRRFGKFVESLGGKYITAEDVGISPADMEFVSKETKNVVGLPGRSGDPSPVTAYGVYSGIKACLKQRFGNDSLAGKKVSVQGVGHVGYSLVEYLTKDGAKVYVTDIHEDTLKQVADKFKATVVKPEDIYDLDVDVYSPCALGATVNDNTLPRLKCSIIAGAANNQLKDETIHGKAVMDKGILYAPDFAINAGGLMNCYHEILGYNADAAMKQASGIYDTITAIIKTANEKGIPTYLAANHVAEERIRAKGGNI
ncbi:MAG TPA: Glu/Leu/Phe/Val dehydrogenase dimerization domain-containing protein [Flavobacteriales bacterium]|nr:Glu/Leu/Phe/Val dehydrogenase dimerization domain-containing protein [Flavobacteriales bacterium]